MEGEVEQDPNFDDVDAGDAPMEDFWRIFPAADRGAGPHPMFPTCVGHRPYTRYIEPIDEVMRRCREEFNQDRTGGYYRIYFNVFVEQQIPPKKCAYCQTPFVYNEEYLFVHNNYNAINGSFHKECFLEYIRVCDVPFVTIGHKFSEGHFNFVKIPDGDAAGGGKSFGRRKKSRRKSRRRRKSRKSRKKRKVKAR